MGSSDDKDYVNCAFTIKQHGNKIGIENYHSEFLRCDISITVQIKFTESSLAAYTPPFRVKLCHLVYMKSCCDELFEVHKPICVAVNLPQNNITDLVLSTKKASYLLKKGGQHGKWIQNKVQTYCLNNLKHTGTLQSPRKILCKGLLKHAQIISTSK